MNCLYDRLRNIDTVLKDRCTDNYVTIKLPTTETRLPCRGRQLTSWDNRRVCAAINSDYDPSAVFSQRKN